MSTATGSAPASSSQKGNGFGEEIIKTLVDFDYGTPYKTVVARAKEISEKEGIVLGRNFPTEVWTGRKAV